LTGEGAARGFVAHFDDAQQIWKTRSSSVSDFTGLTSDVQAIYAVGPCGDRSCVEKYSVAGARLWSQAYGDAGSMLTALVAPGNGHVYAAGSTGAAGAALLVDANADDGGLLARATYSVNGGETARAITTRGNDLVIVGDAKTPVTKVFAVRFHLDTP
jgi:hypothetical protein